MPLDRLRAHIKTQFTETLQEEQIRKKVTFLHNRMLTSYSDLKRSVCKNVDVAQIIESECKMVEEMKTTQKTH